MPAPVPISSTVPRSFQQWVNISATPVTDFNLDAGVYGLTLKAASWGTGVALLRYIPDGTVNGAYVPVAAVITADGYTTMQLTAGRYKMSLGTTTGFSGDIALIAPGSG